MKNILIALALLALIIVPSSVLAADCSNIARYHLTSGTEVVSVDMTGAASGGAFTSCTVPLQGYLVEAIADGDDTTHPTDDWDFTMTKEGRDVLGGYGTDMNDTEETSLKDAGMSWQMVNGDYTLAISNNSVNSAKINFKFYVAK